MTTNLERFRQAARDVADHLDGWTVQFDELEMRNGWARAELVGPDGMAVNLRGQGGDRWDAWGIHPGSSPHYPHSITQTWTRPAKALAGDLSRRLLPTYAIEYATHLAIDAQHRAEDEAAERLVTRAAEVLPGLRTRVRNGHDENRADYRPDWEGSYGWDVPQDGIARVTLKARTGYGAKIVAEGLNKPTALATLAAIAEQQAAATHAA